MTAVSPDLHYPTYLGVDADEGTWQGVCQELFLNFQRLHDDLVHLFLRALVLQVAVQQACKVGVQTLVSTDELVRERQTAHKAALLEPEDSRKRTREKDALDTGKGDQAYPKGNIIGDVFHSPIRLLLDARNVLHSLEQEVLLILVLHIRLNQEAVRLGMDLLDHRLERIEGTRFGNLDFGGELRDKILANNSVG